MKSWIVFLWIKICVGYTKNCVVVVIFVAFLWNLVLSKDREREMIIRRHYYVSGRVQGVGFRYRAYYTAQNLGLTGYVVNLSDGRVELEVQGEESLVRDFLGRVEEGSFIHIDGIESFDMELQTSDRGFYID